VSLQQASARILTSDRPTGLSDFVGPAGAASDFQIPLGFQGRSPCLDSYILIRKLKSFKIYGHVTGVHSAGSARILTSDRPTGLSDFAGPAGPLLTSKSRWDFKGEALV
jgi:hypothetical protein